MHRCYEWKDDSMLLHTLMCACKLVNNRVKTRLPIQIGLLEILLFELERLFNNQWYLEIMYKCILIIGYYGLFRVGELALGDHTIKAKNVHLGQNKNKILITLYTSKTHGQESAPQEIKITGQTRRHFCPFRLTHKFMNPAGGFTSDQEQFLSSATVSPVQPAHVRDTLSQLLSTLNLNPLLYNTHSLRSGRSCDLIKFGYSIEQVKKLGRWKSNAVYKYLK